MDDMEAGAAPGMMEQGAKMPGGYTICLKVAADGGISVGVEREGAEMAEAMPSAPGAAPAEMGAEAESESYMPAASIKEALTTALEIYRNDGQMPDGGQADAEFGSGYTNRMPG